jgi:hypothetical protein
MDDARRRLDEALHRLTADGTLTGAQADAVRRELAPAVPPPGPAATDDSADDTWLSTVAELGGYTGAVFVLGALFALLGPGWRDLGFAVRLVLLVGAAGGVLFAVRHLDVGTTEGARRRLVQVLLVIAVALGGGVAGLLTPAGGDERTVPLVLLLGAAAAYRHCGGLVTHVATIVAAAVFVITFGDWTGGGALLGGVLLVLLGAGWGWATWTRVLPEREVGLVAAGAVAFIGTEFLVVDGPAAALGYLLMLGVAAAGAAAYVTGRELVTLGVAGLALVVLVPQLLIQYTDGALGAAAGLLTGGFLLVGGSVLAFRRAVSV